ncbi:MAG: hypothetical protein N3D11_01520 [Candidatus Sumerlaeia bacterium]|nr:hypothetical protein [Candidatus Sumerlaeia bacterium]
MKTTVIGVMTVALSAMLLTVNAQPPVQVSLSGVSVIRAKASTAPQAETAELQTPGVDLALMIRVTDGRRIRSVGEIEIIRALDDTGASVPVLTSVKRTSRKSVAGGATVTESVSRSIKVQTTVSASAPAGVTALRPGKGREIRVAVAIPEQTGGTTAAVTAHLGLPAPAAKMLRWVGGKIAVQIGEMKERRFPNIESLVGTALDLDAGPAVTLRVIRAAGGTVTLEASGDVQRLGDFDFFNAQGERLVPNSVSRRQEVTNGVGQLQTEFGFGNPTGPLEMRVAVFGAVETVEAPFVFENVELP